MSLFSSIGKDDEDILPPQRNIDVNFPLDCLGVIIRLTIDPSILKCLLLACYHFKNYIEHNPECCKHVQFTLKNPPKTLKPYVVSLTVKNTKKLGIGLLKRFPSLKFLHLIEASWITNSFLRDCTELEKLVMESCKKIDEPPFDSLPMLRVLKIDNSHFGYNDHTLLKTNVFEHLKNLESLELKNVKMKNFDPTHFRNLKNLKKLHLDRSMDFKSSTLIHFSNLESLSVESMRFQLVGLQHLKKVRELTIRMVSEVFFENEVIDQMGREPEIFTFQPARMMTMKMGKVAPGYDF